MSPPDGPFGLSALWRAYRACRKGKRQARDTQRYESRLLDRLVSTRDAIASLRWRPSPALSFVVRRPKLREIHAARFGDRVVHHLQVGRLERLQSFLRSAAGGTCRPVYVLKLDIANCFNSIHRPTHRVPRRRVVRHFHAWLAAYERAHLGRSGLRLPPRARERQRTQAASFRAHCRHASAAGVWQRTLERFPWLRGMLDHAEGGSLAEPLRPGWHAISVSGLAGQYRALARRHPDVFLLLEVGNRWLWPESAARAAGQAACGTPVLRRGLGRCREIAAAGPAGAVQAPAAYRAGLRAGGADRAFPHRLQAPRDRRILVSADGGCRASVFFINPPR